MPVVMGSRTLFAPLEGVWIEIALKAICYTVKNLENVHSFWPRNSAFKGSAKKIIRYLHIFSQMVSVALFIIVHLGNTLVLN